MGNREFYCTRCKQTVAGKPARETPRTRLCAACLESVIRAQREKNSAAVKKCRAARKAETPAKKEGEYICTRCGRTTYGEPVLSGPKRAVCQLCVNAARGKQREHSKRSALKLRAREAAESKVDADKRVCERCGTTQFIYAFQRRGRGRSRWCMVCEERFCRYDTASARKFAGEKDSGDMVAEMIARQMRRVTDEAE